MHALVDIKKYREDKNGTDLMISVPDMQLGDMLRRKKIKNAEIRFDDGRHISAEQMKRILKDEHMIRTGDPDFSLSNCSMDTAREFINTILEFALEWGIPLSDNAINRTDDIGRYLYYCIMHKKCAICGRDGEIHHEDAIGMGNDRRRVDDSGYKKICLCRMHHTMAHQLGVKRFQEMYKVYGIVVKEG